MEDIFRIGIITKPHGIKGEMKVYPTTDDLNRFKKLKKCFIRTKKGDIEVEKASCKFFKNMVILAFKDYDNINLVEGFRDCDIFVTRENAVPLKEDEYYIADVISSEVFDEEGNKLGVVDDVMQTGANDVFVVTMENDKEVLIPVINDCVLDIDTANQKVIVRLMKGMLD